MYECTILTNLRISEFLKEIFTESETENYNMKLSSRSKNSKIQNSQWKDILEFELSKQ